MRKIYLLFVAGSMFTVVLVAAGYDSSAEQREDRLASILDELPVLVSAKPAEDLSVGFAADLFVPVFTSNFCELVVFPELGSDDLLEGFERVARGPPKSQKSIPDRWS
jgi:hypothetical protein